MNKRLSALIACTVLSSVSVAGTIDSVGTYRGAILSVAPGFFAGIGVALEGVTCNGQPVAFLPYSDPHYKDMLAVLLSAQATGQNARMYRMLDTISYGYCTISSASVGDFPFW